MDKEQTKKDVDPGCDWMADIGDRRLMEMLIMNDTDGLAQVRAFKASLDKFIAEKNTAIDACKDDSELLAIVSVYKRPRLVLE